MSSTRKVSEHPNSSKKLPDVAEAAAEHEPVEAAQHEPVEPAQHEPVEAVQSSEAAEAAEAGRLERRHRLRRRLRGLLAMDGCGLDPYLLVGAERKAARQPNADVIAPPTVRFVPIADIR